ncbi:hypothetical protein CHS0354_012821 [Potamilus streckersoni]|uniref:Uncharacterized protein n=1 Tax=Potamilus streckersoni TaxID=2493646 RepID=A0AAE0SX60_9BIVA|nr:hypothetical protein CHS0354_012821 [Potamilus streckersoni]
MATPRRTISFVVQEHSSPPRGQRIFIRLSRFNEKEAEVTGKLLVVPDTLTEPCTRSRIPMRRGKECLYGVDGGIQANFQIES